MVFRSFSLGCLFLQSVFLYLRAPGILFGSNLLLRPSGIAEDDGHVGLLRADHGVPPTRRQVQGFASFGAEERKWTPADPLVKGTSSSGPFSMTSRKVMAFQMERTFEGL